MPITPGSMTGGGAGGGAGAAGAPACGGRGAESVESTPGSVDAVGAGVGDDGSGVGDGLSVAGDVTFAASSPGSPDAWATVRASAATSVVRTTPPSTIARTSRGTGRCTTDRLPESAWRE